jgi:hypothetical protein
MNAPHFQIGDRVRVGVVDAIDTKTLGAQTVRGPRYHLKVNGHPYGWLHELDLVPDGELLKPTAG